MGSIGKSCNLPVLDFTKGNLKLGTNSWRSASKDVRDALENHSAFLVVYEGVSEELKDEAFDLLEKLCNLPKETKVKSSYDVPTVGYFTGRGPRASLMESFGILDVTNADEIRKFTTLMWPSGNDHCSEIIQSYSLRVSELQKMIMGIMFESYGVEKYCDSHIKSTVYHLRATKYGVFPLNETYIGIPPHTDVTFLSILQENQVEGLEIKQKDGKWISVDFPPSSFVVLAGDALEAWSNGRIHAALHRVTMGVKQTRYSLGVSSFHKGIVEIPEEMVDEEHPLQFKSFDHLGYTPFVIKNTDLPQEGKMKYYCGV